jgi:hypothetical protein
MILYRQPMNDGSELILDHLGTNTKPWFLCQLRHERAAYPARSITFFLQQMPDVTRLVKPMLHLAEHLLAAKDPWPLAQKIEHFSHGRTIGRGLKRP